MINYGNNEFGVKFIRNIFVVSSLFLCAGCVTTGVTVVEEGAVEGDASARGPVIAAEREAVAATLQGEADTLWVSDRGVVAILGDEVVSYGVDPVKLVWSHRAPGPVLDVVVGWDGESLLVRHRADIGPWAQERVIVLDAENGEMIASHPSEGMPRGLAHDTWVSTTESGRVVVHQVSTGDKRWEYDPSEACSAESAADVEVLADKFTVLVSHACPEDDEARLAEFVVDSGSVIKQVTWDGPAPALHTVLPHTVTGGPEDAVARMFAEEVNKEFLFLDTRYFTPVLPAPWRDAGITDHLDPPAMDFADAPTDIVVGNVAEMNDLLIVRSVRALALEPDIPFNQEDLDDSLLIDGELVESPYQWQLGRSGYMSALSNALVEAFPSEE
ncbi:MULTISPECIES: hypothetical protein [unclassified Nocardiopsis]|uniref:hypothetical protein n=1 Tax=Nocardiopsis TaxID=2013 RepID=UPI00387B47F7